MKGTNGPCTAVLPPLLGWGLKSSKDLEKTGESQRSCYTAHLQHRSLRYESTHINPYYAYSIDIVLIYIYIYTKIAERPWCHRVSNPACDQWVVQRGTTSLLIERLFCFCIHIVIPHSVWGTAFETPALWSQHGKITSAPTRVRLQRHGMAIATTKAKSRFRRGVDRLGSSHQVFGGCGKFMVSYRLFLFTSRTYRLNVGLKHGSTTFYGCQAWTWMRKTCLLPRYLGWWCWAGSKTAGKLQSHWSPHQICHVKDNCFWFKG